MVCAKVKALAAEDALVFADDGAAAVLTTATGAAVDREKLLLLFPPVRGAGVLVGVL